MADNKDLELEEVNEFDEDEDIITLLDGDKEYEFEVIDYFEYDGRRYYAVLPLFEDVDKGIEADEAYIIFEEITDSNGETKFVEPSKELLGELEDIVDDFLNGKSNEEVDNTEDENEE